MAKKKATPKQEAAFTKAQLLQSTQFPRSQKDILHALLEDSGAYTLDQAKQIIQEFLQREAK